MDRAFLFTIFYCPDSFAYAAHCLRFLRNSVSYMLPWPTGSLFPTNCFNLQPSSSGGIPLGFHLTTSFACDERLFFRRWLCRVEQFNSKTQRDFDSTPEIETLLRPDIADAVQMRGTVSRTVSQ